VRSAELDEIHFEVGLPILCRRSVFNVATSKAMPGCATQTTW
jgi:hypothetical protein